MKTPKTCGQCGTEDSLVPIGPGIERVAEEAAKRFPEARRVILSSDMGSNAQLRDRFAEIERGEHDLIIGTQLVAKGHHFEKLTLVGVLDADLGLNHGDPRAAEKTFQILTQVTGRAGRAARAGRAFLQTYHPTHPVITAMVAGDREAFYAHEMAAREQGELPPFGRLAALIFSGNDHDETFGFARRILSKAPMAEGIRLFGPRRCAHRHGARPPPRPPAGAKPEDLRSQRLCPVLAGQCRKGEGKPEDTGRYRSAELLLTARLRPRRHPRAGGWDRALRQFVPTPQFFHRLSPDIA